VVKLSRDAVIKYFGRTSYERMIVSAGDVCVAAVIARLRLWAPEADDVGISYSV